MRASGGGYRVAVLGAASLLGRELEKILRERRFPFSTFAAVEQGEESLASECDPEEEIPGLLSLEEAADVEWDFLFLAGSGALDTALVGAVLDHGGRVIDLVDGNGVLDCGGELRIVSFPLREFTAQPARRANLFGSPHPATILLAALTGNLERKFSIAAATAEVFESASARGGEGIKELQEQTWNLLQFQKIPKKVFGAQLAFNVLPRLGTERARKGGLAEGGVLRRELEYFLSGSLLMPVPRVFQLPVFYSIAVSLLRGIDRADFPGGSGAGLGGVPGSGKAGAGRTGDSGGRAGSRQHPCRSEPGERTLGRGLLDLGRGRQRPCGRLEPGGNCRVFRRRRHRWR